MAEPKHGLQIMVARTQEGGSTINTTESFPSPDQLVREVSRRHGNRVGDLWITLPMMMIGVAAAGLGFNELIHNFDQLHGDILTLRILQTAAGAGCAAGGLWVSLKSTSQNHFYALVMYAAENPNHAIPYNPR